MCVSLNCRCGGSIHGDDDGEYISSLENAMGMEGLMSYMWTVPCRFCHGKLEVEHVR